jgi:hypothetical protein
VPTAGSAGRLRGAGLRAPATPTRDPYGDAPAWAGGATRLRTDERGADDDRETGGLRGWWQRFTRGPEE